jgi:hypothetical protein
VRERRNRSDKQQNELTVNCEIYRRNSGDEQQNGQTVNCERYRRNCTEK